MKKSIALSLCIAILVYFLIAFSFYNRSLENIEIPSSVEHIDSYAFNGCKSLKAITIPSSVTQMRGNAFVYCTSLETINCEAAKKPDGWDNDWLHRECTATVNWGYTEG
ncbi:MAG: leucine-rich repeat domain-containing protein [Clostridia bacterium]|nr:leucine-rich repeat domain-containing protein [Clostridia bacterium]